MRRSKSEVYLHLVWTTYNHTPWLTPALVPPIYACIGGVAQRLSCTVLAIGGMADHVHLAVKLAPTISIAQLAQQVKGASSKRAGDLGGPEASFRWQEGYSAFSLSRPDVPKVITYVKNQPRHHAAGKFWAVLEEADEEAPPRVPLPSEGRP